MSSRLISVDLGFAEAAEFWLDSQVLSGSTNRARYVAPRTLRDDRQHIVALNRFFGDLPLREIHIGHFCEYQDQRAAGALGVTREVMAFRLAKRHKCTVEELLASPEGVELVDRKTKEAARPVGANKINQELSLLHRILKRAGLWTPEFEECYQPLWARPADIPKALSPEEQARFLDAAASREEWRVVYWYSLLALETTCSNCELRGLRRQDINLFQKVVTIRGASAKNGHRVRSIPLTPNAQWALERIEERARTLGSVAPNHCLFPFAVKRNEHDPERPMTYSGIRKDWEAVREASGLRWFGFHGLRHTGITRLAEQGVPIAIIMSLAGHISAKMTQHYTSVSEAAKNKALLQTFAPGRGGSKRGPRKSPGREHLMAAHAAHA